jgi:ABC-type transport system involved in multi-copper enzyme maturation permease subunit
MKRLSKIAFRKLYKSRVFWIMLLLYAVSMSGMLFGVEAFINKIASNTGKNSPIPIPDFSLYEFPYIWHNLSYLAGFLKLFPALILMVFVAADYSYRTNRMQMMMGLSRTEYFFTQVLLVLALAIFSALLLVFWAMAKGLVHSTDLNVGSIFGKSYFVAAYFLELIAFLSFALLLVTTLRKSGLSIIAFSISFIAIEPIIRVYVPDVVAQNMPFKRIGSMIDVPNTSLMQLFGFNFKTYIDLSDLAITLLYTILFLVLTYWIIKRRDL